jgi:hypothetical protein
MEWIYALMTYGILHHLIPVTASGKIKLKNHMAFLEMQQVAEKYTNYSKLQSVELPLAFNILIMGKGKPFQEHTANMCLHTLVDVFMPLCHMISSDNKGKLRWRIQLSRRSMEALAVSCGKKTVCI